MTRKRRSFTAEFNLDAECLILDQGYSVSEASRSSDVGETVIRRWDPVNSRLSMLVRLPTKRR